MLDFGGRAANARAAAALLTAALYSRDAQIQDTLTAVVSAYFDAQTTLATLKAKQTSQQLAQQTVEAAQRREARGAGAQSDTLQAATAQAKAALDQGRALGAHQKALSVLVYAVGLATATKLVLPEDDPELRLGAQDVGPSQNDAMVNAKREVNDWLALAQARHPAIAAARQQVAAALAKVTATQSEGRPSLDFSTNYYANGRPNQGLTPTSTRERTMGVTLNVPLFEGFARTYKVQGALANVTQKEAQLQDTEHQVLMEVVKAHADTVAALENLGASQKLRETAELALASVQRKFDKGAADILEMLSAQTALSDARLERIRCLAEWRSASLRLLANVGGL